MLYYAAHTTLLLTNETLSLYQTTTTPVLCSQVMQEAPRLDGCLAPRKPFYGINFSRAKVL
jgi:hypothetical protein